MTKRRSRGGTTFATGWRWKQDGELALRTLGHTRGDVFGQLILTYGKDEAVLKSVLAQGRIVAVAVAELPPNIVPTLRRQHNSSEKR